MRWMFTILFAAVLGGLPARSAGISASARAPFWSVSTDHAGQLFLWDAAGMRQPGWPVAASGAWPAGTPRLQDLDGDGQPGVVCLMKTASGGRELRAWRLDGQPWPGFDPLPAPADMADTPEAGVLSAGAAAAWVWPTQGGAVMASAVGHPNQILQGFPLQATSGRLRLRLADLEGDGVMEVLGGAVEGAAGRWCVVQFVSGLPHLDARGMEFPVPAPPCVVRPFGATSRWCAVCLGSGEVRAFAVQGSSVAAQSSWSFSDGSFQPRWLESGEDPTQPLRIHGLSGEVRVCSAVGGLLGRMGTPGRIGTEASSCEGRTAAGAAAWMEHDGDAAWALCWSGGADSAGRVRMGVRSMGRRHHPAPAQTPAGLLPPDRVRLRVNGQEVERGRPMLEFPAGDLEVTCSADHPALFGSLPMDLLVQQGIRVVASDEGRDPVRIRFRAGPGRYLAAAFLLGDTLATAEFEVRPVLELRSVLPFPNPMHSQVEFLVEQSTASTAHLEVYTVSGRRVRSLEGVLAGPSARLPWDGRDAWGAPVPGGVYLYKLLVRSGTQSASQIGKLIRLP